MVRFGTVAALFLLMRCALALPLLGQERPLPALGPDWVAAPTPVAPKRAAVMIPDSLRQRVGYHHWKGAAIGGGVGALAGLALALAPHGQCDDCPSNVPSVGTITLTGAGLGGTLGFLIGLASPRYRWVARPPD